MTTAERLQQIRAEKAANAAASTASTTQKTAAQRLAEIRAQKTAPALPAPKTEKTMFDPTFPAAMGGASTVPGNIARTAGNIPSSAANLARAVVAPVNPFDINSPLNIGANLAKGADALGSIFKDQKPADAFRNIGGGFAQTAKDIGAGAANLAKEAINNPSSIAKIGIEDPLLIPSVLYAPSRALGRDAVSVAAAPARKPLGSTGDFLKESADAAIAKNKQKVAKDLVMPERTPSVKRDQVSRTTETGKGIFIKSEIAPTRAEQLAIDEVSKIPGVNAGNSYQKNYLAVREYNQGLAQKLESDIAQNDFAIPRREVVSKLNAAKEELAQSPTIVGDAQKTAERLMDGAIRILNENPGTGSGLLKARKEYDAWVLSQKPKAFDGATENAFTLANRAVRDVFNDTLDANVSNVAVKESLRRQSALYRALDNIEAKAAKEADTFLGRLDDRLSKVLGTRNRVIQGAATLVGVGTFGAATTFAAPFSIGAAGLYATYQAGRLVLKPEVRRAIGNILSENGNKLPVRERKLLQDLLAPNAAIEDIIENASLPETPSEAEESISSQQSGQPVSSTSLPGTVPQAGTLRQDPLGRARVGVADVLKGIPEAAGNLAMGAAGQTGKGLGMIADGFDMEKRIPDTFLGIEDKENKMTRAVELPKIDPTGMVGNTVRTAKGGIEAAPGIFEGFIDLSTKLLEKLKGRSTVSRQFISDLTNSPDLKQTEKDVIRRVLEDEGDKINVPAFAEKVKAELLPLNVKGANEMKVSKQKARAALKARGISIEKDMDGGGYPVDKDGEYIEYDELPEDTRKLLDRVMGGAETYDDLKRTNRYENINLPDELRGPVANYQERIYESPVKTSAGGVHFGGETDNYFGHTRVEDLPDGTTSRVIEVQSDLFQKGRFDNEFLEGIDDLKDARSLGEGVSNKLVYGDKARDAAKLEPYKNNAAHFRMIREEVKQAAKDGKTKLQFPTGETAMKIEGLGGRGGGAWVLDNGSNPLVSDLQAGKTIYRSTDYNGIGTRPFGEQWIITDVLGDGKFKAVPKWAKDKADADMLDGIDGYRETFDISGDVSEVKLVRKFDEAKAKYGIDSDEAKDANRLLTIFKFYEKEVGKYLKSKYGAELITDPQGVKWWQINVGKEQAKMPVEAFGVLGAVGLGTAVTTPATINSKEN